MATNNSMPIRMTSSAPDAEDGAVDETIGVFQPTHNYFLFFKCTVRGVKPAPIAISDFEQ